MEAQGKKQDNQDSAPAPAAEHVAEAHRLMKALQDKIGKHPELEEAVHNLEVALSALTVKTAGLL